MEKRTAKKIVFVFIFMLILGIGGFFLWKNNQNMPPEKWMEARISPFEEFVLEEVPDGKLIENKNAGINFKVPEDWINREGYSSFYSPDAEFNENRSDVFQKGCMINVDVSYIRTNIDVLEKFQRENIDQLSSVTRNVEFRRTEIKNFSALAYGFEVENLKMSYSWVEIPYKNKVYSMLLTSSIKEKERCQAEFNKFLDSISIKI